MQKYPTKPDTIAPTVSNIKSELTISVVSIFRKGNNKDAPKIIGILNKKEYLAAVFRSKPKIKPVDIVNPERENPGSAAKP